MTTGGRPDLTAVEAAIRDVTDFPVPGVVFKDIAPVLGDAVLFAAVIDAMADLPAGSPVDVVVGIEARGFILGAALAHRLGAGFVPIRKQGKLPGATYSTAFDLEYGSAVLQLHQDAFRDGQRLLVVDDVLATGGTCSAAVQLLTHSTRTIEVVAACMLLELPALGGRSALAAAHPALTVHALLRC